jgi:hypothetical protein
VLRSVAGSRRRLLRHLHRRLHRRAAAFDHPEHLERIDAEQQACDHDHDDRAAAELHASTYREAAARRLTARAVLDVVAPAKISPTHRHRPVRAECWPGASIITARNERGNRIASPGFVQRAILTLIRRHERIDHRNPFRTGQHPRAEACGKRN